MGSGNIGFPDGVDGVDVPSTGGTVNAIPVASNLCRPGSTASGSFFNPALFLFGRVAPTLSASSAIIPFAIGNTETSPPFASTIALVLRADKNPAFVVADDGRKVMAEPQLGQRDFWRFRAAGLHDGILAPTPIEGFRFFSRDASDLMVSVDSGWNVDSEAVSAGGIPGIEMSG